MKKLALVLGSLLVVGSAVSAKEVMPAPEAVPEKVVEYVEKPVIVYRDREVTPAWRPNGSFSLTYKWYGETENKNPGEDTDKDWATTPSNAGRLQTLTNINFTEKQTLEVRSRNYHTLRDTEKDQSKISNDSLRVRHFYKFGTLGNSKVKATSRLHYNQSNGDAGTKTAEARLMFNFADYFPSNEYFKVTKFEFGPKYAHVWSRHGNDSTRNIYGIDFQSTYQLPYGFSAEFNLYTTYDRYREKRLAVGNDGEMKNGEFRSSMEAYLYYNTSLYKNDKFDLGLNVEGGYDTYEFHQYKVVKNYEGKRSDKRSYELYLMPYVGVSYKATDNVKLSLNVGAEYRNWKIGAESEAKNWRWQPTAWAGMRVNF